MGTKCCTSIYRETEVDSDKLVSISSYEKIDNKHGQNLKGINEVQSIFIHHSKFFNKIEKKSIGSAKKEFGPHLKCTTNFKIEPQCFRIEKNIDSLEDIYILEDSIGKGGFGEVKRIKNKSNGACRALKIINKSNCQMTDNFADEIEIIKKLVN